MKYLLACVNFTLAIFVVYAEINFQEDATAYDYHRKIGIPLAIKVKKAEILGQLELPEIVGGTIIDISQVPYQAGLIITLFLGLTSLCGGTIISNTRIMTAAHCASDGIMKARSFTVVLGSNTVFYGGERIESSDFVVHSHWDPTNAVNDIAIICIPAIVFTDSIQHVNLPSVSQLRNSFVGWTALASGYGRTGDENGSIRSNQRIKSVNLTVIHNSDCEMVYGTQFVRDTNICTSGNEGRGTCSGDSGGPLVVTINNSRVVIGITSFGAKVGCTAGYPAAYTRVSSYVFWIQTI